MTCLPTTGPQKPRDKRAMQAVVRTRARYLQSTPVEEPIHLGGKSRPAEWGVYFLTHQPERDATEGARVTRVGLLP